MVSTNLSNQKKFRVIVFDMDGTLIKEHCWQLLHDYYGIDWRETLINVEDYAAGKLSFKELVEREIKLWKRGEKLPHIDEVKAALKKYTLVKNAGETVLKLRQANLVTALVSYGLDILAQMVASDLGIEFVYANTLELDSEGYLTGNQFNKVELGRKDEIVKELVEKLKIPLSQFVAVGDTKYDLSMFRGVGLKIAFNPKDRELAQVADMVIETDDLAQLLKFVGLDN